MIQWFTILDKQTVLFTDAMQHNLEKQIYLFQVSYPRFLINLVPQGKILPEINNMYDNTTDTTNMIHINISKTQQGENFSSEYT